MTHREPRETDHEDVLGETERPVRERLRRRIRHDTRARFRQVRRQRDGTTEQGRQGLRRRRCVAERRDGNEGAAERPHDGVQGVPHRVDPGHLVGYELHAVHDECDADDPWVLEHAELLWQRHQTKTRAQPDDSHRRIEVDTRRKRKGHDSAEGVYQVHASIVRALALVGY